MSTTDGDASSRLSNALEEILTGGPATVSPDDDEAPAPPIAEPVLEESPPQPAPVTVVDEAALAEPVPAVPVTDEAALAEPVPAVPVTDEAALAEPVPVVPVTGEAALAEPVPAVPVTGEAALAEPPTPVPVPDDAVPGRTNASSDGEFTADWTVDDDDDDVPGDYELPEIVPATNPLPLPDTVPAARAAPAVPTPSPPVAPNTVAAPAPAEATATSWGDHMPSSVPVGAQGAPLRAPGRRPRVRRVTRVLRHIDPWSTFKVALLFSAVAYVVMLTAGVLLWRVADDTGTLANIERWFTQFGWETFELKGGEIFHNAWIIGLFGAVAMTGGIVLLATLFNLVSDIVGGVRLTVLEEEVVERTVSSTRRYVVRRAPAAAAGAATVASTQDWDVDDDSVEEPGSDVEIGPVTADWSVDDDTDDDTQAEPAAG